jgi:hypothetical protein
MLSLMRQMLHDYFGIRRIAAYSTATLAKDLDRTNETGGMRQHVDQVGAGKRNFRPSQKFRCVRCKVKKRNLSERKVEHE